ncbi:MAG: hypothetical protein QOJ99_1989 [Bryobacterales bacterium]|jgi:hypothetical protein|nr:hypothetical protein [Bryobacterales bacterium]
MTRLAFWIAALRGPRSLSRFALLYVAGIVFLFFCLIGGLPRIPISPARAVPSPYAAMPQPNPVPANAAGELKKRLNSSPHTGTSR